MIILDGQETIMIQKLFLGLFINGCYPKMQKNIWPISYFLIKQLLLKNVKQERRLVLRPYSRETKRLFVYFVFNH